MLYPKEDVEIDENGNKRYRLIYACRHCPNFDLANVSEGDYVVYQSDFKHSESEKTTILQDIGSDPTLPRTDKHPCPKYVYIQCYIRCGFQEAVFFQSTGVDGMELFFVCANSTCGHRWKDV